MQRAMWLVQVLYLNQYNHKPADCTREWTEAATTYLSQLLTELTTPTPAPAPAPPPKAGAGPSAGAARVRHSLYTLHTTPNPTTADSAQASASAPAAASAAAASASAEPERKREISLLAKWQWMQTLVVTHFHHGLFNRSRFSDWLSEQILFAHSQPFRYPQPFSLVSRPFAFVLLC